MMSSALRQSPSVPFIRMAETCDLPECAAILNNYIDATEWLPRALGHQAVEALFTPDLLKARRVFVAEQDGEILGFLSMFADDGFVPALYLRADARGLGLGKALLDTAKSEHPQGLSLTVFETNLEALKFYRREGFSEDPSGRDDATDEGIPTLLMRWPGGAT